MRLSDFDFELPDDRIALRPAVPRDRARMLVVGADGALTDRNVHDLPELLAPGDALVFNDTRVIPARLKGVRHRDAAATAVEATLLKRLSPSHWSVLAKPGRRLKVGDRIVFGESADRACFLGALDATVKAKLETGEVILSFDLSGPDLDLAIAERGQMPLPPYIAAQRREDEQDRTDYQTVYAREDGSVAAPTAGLHFTRDLLTRLAERGVSQHFVTLHVGAGTFLPVKVDEVSEHRMHPEYGEVTAQTAAALNAVKARGGRIIAVGTTALRLLESAAEADGTLHPFAAETSIFITPGYAFRTADALMTNFHLPRSTLFMLVSAFAGLETMRGAYAHALESGYRFYSYGDSSLLWEGPPMSAFPFRIDATDGAARTGVIQTPRGEIRTPAFMPVGTAGTVKGLLTSQVRSAGADILLGNTYHLMLRPSAERVKRLGGLHKFMGWDGPILTDSGGFQVMSLTKINKVTEDAVTFQSHIDGSRHLLSPERSIEIQADLLGSDIVMQLDECVAWPAEEAKAGEAMRLSARWAQRCKAAFGTRDSQALFGIQQGSTFEALRSESAQRLTEIGFDGYAIGGLAVGEGHEAMCEVLDFAPAMLPADRPRYLMGVGKPQDLIEAVYRGIDMFDCVLPTRSGRHGQAWTWEGPINLKAARFTDDEAPLDAASDCPASRDYSKAYLHHLVKCEELLGQVLLSWHNVAFFEGLMAGMRKAIAEGRLDAFRREAAARRTPV